MKWLSDTNYALPAYSVLPAAARIEVGFADGEYLPAQMVNYLLAKYSRILYGEQTRLIHSSAGESNVNGAADWVLISNGAYREYVVSSQLSFPIEIDVGQRIKTIHAYVRGTATGGTVTLKAWKSTRTGSETQLGSTQTTSAAATDQTLTISGLTETAVAETLYQVAIGGAEPNEGQRLYGIAVVLDRP